MTKEEFMKLVESYGNAAYDCGAWMDEPPEYATVLTAYKDAKETLMEAYVVIAERAK